MKRSILLTPSQQQQTNAGWAEEYAAAPRPSSSQLSRNSTETWVASYVSGEEATGAGHESQATLASAWEAAVTDVARFEAEGNLESAWAATGGLQADMEAAWQAGEQTAGWADEFDSDAAR